MKTTEKDIGNTIISFIILAVIVVFIAAGTWVYLTIYIQNPSYDSLLNWKNKQDKIDETAGWKTQASTKYGYSFKYPPSWHLTDSMIHTWEPGTWSHNFRVLAGDEAKIDIDDIIAPSIIKVSDLPSEIDSIIDEMNKNIPHPVKILEKKAVEINGLPGYLTKEQGDSTVFTFYFVRGGKLNLFDVVTSMDASEEMENTILNIINSFKLLYI